MNAERPAGAVTSTPVLRTTLIWSAVVTAALAVIGALIGWAIAGPHGLFSALAGVVLAAVFLGVTGVSILVANRWFGDPLYVQIFFGIVLGGWLLKFVVFLIVLLVLRGQDWVEPMIMFVAIVAGIVASLVIDVVVMTRMRLPAVNVDLPRDADEGEAREDADRGNVDGTGL